MRNVNINKIKFKFKHTILIEHFIQFLFQMIKFLNHINKLVMNVVDIQR